MKFYYPYSIGHTQFFSEGTNLEVIIYNVVSFFFETKEIYSNGKQTTLESKASLRKDDLKQLKEHQRAQSAIKQAIESLD